MDQFREVARRTVRSKGDVGNVGKEMAHPKRFELLTPRFVVRVPSYQVLRTSTKLTVITEHYAVDGDSRTA